MRAIRVFSTDQMGRALCDCGVPAHFNRRHGAWLCSICDQSRPDTVAYTDASGCALCKYCNGGIAYVPSIGLNGAMHMHPLCLTCDRAAAMRAPLGATQYSTHPPFTGVTIPGQKFTVVPIPGTITLERECKCDIKLLTSVGHGPKCDYAKSSG